MSQIGGPPRLVLETRRKWEIPNELREERHPVALQAAIDIWKELRPDAEFRSITATYNCVGMVVGSRRVWAWPENLHKILTDDGYRRLPGPEQAHLGDVVIYHDDSGNPCHVGIIVRMTTLVSGGNDDQFFVLSKWGADGEYVHKSKDVPDFCGRPAEYWSHRRRP